MKKKIVVQPFLILMLLGPVLLTGCTSGSTPVYTIGSSVSGLSGTGLVLQDNGGDNLSIGANGTFTFATPVASGAIYKVTVFSQPSNPTQTCVVASGSGTVSSTNVTNVSVTCTTNTYSIGGAVSGLSGTGLILQDNGGDNLSIDANGTFTFPTPIASGATYQVTALSQPSNPTQTCVVASNGGKVSSANITTVTITCTTNTYTLSSSVSGLSGTGLVLQDNGGDNLSIGANGTFTFPTPIASGATYQVTALSQPSNLTQTCVVASGSGTVSSTNVTNVLVTCTTNTYTIGGAVSGLSGTGLVLQDNGGDNLSISANGTFTFPTPIASGAIYQVTVFTQPAGPVQICGVTSDKGTVSSANVSNVSVDCSHNEWTWVSGSNIGNQQGVYGSPGTASAGNVPGARQSPVNWTDTSGNLWFFGGYGYDSTGALGYLNDLWKFDGTQWTWVSGFNIVNQQGVYGIQGAAAAGNVPGARYPAVSWTDAGGNLWLFGGYGYDSTGNLAWLNDLWKFDGAQWMWVSGSNIGNQQGAYGNQGIAATGNVPGARDSATSWIDANGNLWLFGGYGYDLKGTLGWLNDLWKFDGTQWTWVSGSNIANQQGVYGTQGTADAGNVPGARYPVASWKDASGNLWLFGGAGYDSAGTLGYLNDLWKFDGTQWTWVSGSNIADQQGVYGTQGAAATGNVPGARQLPVGWKDASGNLWLFGGAGFDSTGTLSYLNDLWMYKP